MQVARFIDEVSRLAFDNVFNPYRDVCIDHDSKLSPKIRRDNLSTMLTEALRGRATLWVGRDLGYRGARRTGIPLTDEYHLPVANLKVTRGHFVKATVTEAVKERTATEVWNIVQHLQFIPLFWNVFPWHPHLANNSQSNRAHTARERAVGAAFLRELIINVKPAQIVTLGRDAYEVVNQLGFGSIYARHPSYGGQTEFRRVLNTLYGQSTKQSAEQAAFAF